ncbi:L-glutamine:D-fructose-6-phosphate aminotransferase [Campylobacter iguaniorum]|uniref:Glutamine--fructose-6-phosphate aminotransferase [isomerizing] n=1 Tax=Campylobacter iguaniorum TaxID=1244531 RepID=A0A076F9X2_9BACT|nr:glutamine--fructose-6-phosphate transaminase (isomerizing) [Campylobacter iguaniorum]AII14498.1 L-glutamine:D-fructose-6-phosphate aminotransferase [Campylobacter iguaniorum]ALV24233.1 L-glutamine:D-fructose-6-phosphate aminotransferase [Campylobacter iguaniorum]
MCGIVGYIGSKEKKSVIIGGLKELEYRGYDSAGMAIMSGECCSDIHYFKAVGKLENLSNKMSDFSSEGFGVAIGHTRWATHGKPTEINAHPHLGEYSFVIHNGIIENYKELKDELESQGVKFISQTDTEVIVHLFERYNKTAKSPFEAYKQTIARLRGAYATLLITKAAYGEVFFAKNAAPLIVAKNGDEIYFSSSDASLIGLGKEAMYLEDGVIGHAKLGAIEIFDKNLKALQLSFTELPKDKGYAQKDGYRFFMEKEIYEQSQVISECLMGRVKDDNVNLEVSDDVFDGIDEVVLCACGTSYHAAITASYLFERIAKIRAKVEIASEFRYKEPLLKPNSLFIVISQSGETADTLEALKIAKEHGLKTMAICNVDNSSIVRLAGEVMLTRAGIEKGVASTKAFATQVICLWLLSLKLAKLRNVIDEKTMLNELKALRNIPSVVHFDPKLQERIYRLAKHYLHGHGFFFIGRDIFYPLALEGALKLKEISYLHAEGYPAGEMKHGPIALADDGLYTIALLPSTLLYEKTKSNVEELAARDANITAISPVAFELSDDFIQTNTYEHPMSEFFEMMIVLQLFALEISIRLGNDVDMPRNLAKSVTVE